ncbi:MAG: hypothetical protein ABI306_08725 [Caulobacteraceae bacterium]
MSANRIVSSARALIAGAFLLCAGGGALAQTAQGARHPDTEPAIPRFVVLPPLHPEARFSGSGLPLWNFTWTYQGRNYNGQMVGTTPSGGASTTVPSFIIPIALKVGGKTFTTSTIQSNGQSALADAINSPIFQAGINFVEAGVSLGNTQYIDAFQRGAFWGTVQSNQGYHLLLGQPTVLPLQTITVPKRQGKVGTEFGVQVALVNINFIDAQIASILAANPQITGASVPVFMTYNTYLTQNGCCIGGYHSANGSQSYMQYSYIGTPGAFAQDVSALSHEMGEWADDPLTNNTNTPCGIYEVGDPLENTANYGDYPYVLNGNFTYNLQDMAWPPYFGAPPATSLANRSTFQGTALSVCQNGS